MNEEHCPLTKTVSHLNTELDMAGFTLRFPTPVFVKVSVRYPRLSTTTLPNATSVVLTWSRGPAFPPPESGMLTEDPCEVLKTAVALTDWPFVGAKRNTVCHGWLPAVRLVYVHPETQEKPLFGNPVTVPESDPAPVL